MNENIDVIVKNPKKAIRMLALPIIISNLLILFNTIIDGIWIAGLSVDSLIAIGFVTPLTILFSGFGNGLSSGANSLIARCIGSNNYKSASNAAVHSIILSFVVSIVIPLIFLIFLKQILLIFGAGDVIDLSMQYATIYVAGSFSVFIPLIFSAIFKAQGDAKKATYPFIASAIINVFIDPIFIYILNLGMIGAALATVVAGTLSMIPLIYWLLINKSSYLEINISKYKTNFKIYKEILSVGVPASFEQVSIALSTIIINTWMLMLATANEVAIYNVVWRIIGIGTTPVVCIALAVSTVVGVAYGGKNYHNLKTSLNYGIKLSSIVAIGLGIIFAIFASQFAFIFSYTESTMVINESLTLSIRILTVYLIALPLGAIATLTFQGMGKGTSSLVLTVTRTLILELMFIYLFAFLLNWGTFGVYIGLIFGISSGSIISYLYINLYLKRHGNYFND